MRRFVASTVGSVLVVAALSAAGATAAEAGWRSADRRALEDDDAPVYEEPCEHSPPCGHDPIEDPRRMLYRDYRREPRRQAPAGAATQPYWGTMQPYWGTMRPYWNAGEPGVVRSPRTAPLRAK